MMPVRGLFSIGLLCLVAGIVTILFPAALLKFNATLNRAFTRLDQALARHRYVFGTLLFLTSYLFLRLAFLAPHLRG